MDTEPLQTSEPVAEYLIDEPETETQVDSRPWLFKPGQSGNPAGRPRKGQSAQEKLVAHVNRDADEILAGIVREARKGNTRAFIALWDRAFGVPKQTLVVERPDDPLTRWIQGMTGVSIDGVNAGDQPAIDNGYPALPPPTTE